MRILVTGANGFIGSHVVEHLHARNELARSDGSGERFEIVGLDVAPPSYPIRAAWTDVRGDVRDAALVRRLVGESDAVIHLAGVLGTSETLELMVETASTNVIGSLTVFEAVRDAGRRCVYITVGNEWLNPYSVTKNASAQLARMIDLEQGGRIVVVRGLNAYGPRQRCAPVRKVLPAFATAALTGGELIVHDDGSMVVDLVHVEDLARGLVLAALVPDGPGLYDHVLDLGTERKTTVLDLARTVLQMVDGRVDPERIRFVPMRAGEPRGSVTLGELATSEQLIGFRPRITLEQGLPSTLQWFRDELVRDRSLLPV